jgi:hypothetical protein
MKQVSEKAEVISMVPLRISSSSHTSTSCQSWHDMTWHDMTWHNMTWHDMTWHDTTRHDMWCDVMWCDVMSCDVISDHVMWDEMTWHDTTWHNMTWHHTVTSHHVTRIGWSQFQYLMTYTIMSFAATANIIKQQTLSYTDLNYHNNHHLSLCNHTAASSRVALSCITCFISNPSALSTSRLC